MFPLDMIYIQFMVAFLEIFTHTYIYILHIYIYVYINILHIYIHVGLMEGIYTSLHKHGINLSVGRTGLHRVT
jgi:hypothetical protein